MNWEDKANAMLACLKNVMKYFEEKGTWKYVKTNPERSKSDATGSRYKNVIATWYLGLVCLTFSIHSSEKSTQRPRTCKDRLLNFEDQIKWRAYLKNGKTQSSEKIIGFLLLLMFFQVQKDLAHAQTRNLWMRAKPNKIQVKLCEMFQKVDYTMWEFSSDRNKLL